MDQVKTDRRLFVRLPSCTTLHYRNLETGLRGEALLQDIGAGGLRFSTLGESLSPDDMLEVHINPAMVEPIDIRGKVAWLRKVNSDVCDVGISFLRVRFSSLASVCFSQPSAA